MKRWNHFSKQISEKFYTPIYSIFLLSKLEIQKTSNFINSHLFVNSNIWAIKPIKLIPLVRFQTRKNIKFRTLEQNLSNLNYLFLPLPQYSIRIVAYAFQSFISLIRLEKGFRFFKKIAKFSKNFTSFTHSPHTLFSINFTSSTTLTTPNSQKNYMSLPTTRNKIFEKFYKFRTRAPKKRHAGIVSGGGDSSPPLKYRHFYPPRRWPSEKFSFYIHTIQIGDSIIVYDIVHFIVSNLTPIQPFLMLNWGYQT